MYGFDMCVMRRNNRTNEYSLSSLLTDSEKLSLIYIPATSIPMCVGGRWSRKQGLPAMPMSLIWLSTFGISQYPPQKKTNLEKKFGFEHTHIKIRLVDITQTGTFVLWICWFSYGPVTNVETMIALCQVWSILYKYILIENLNLPMNIIH